MELVMLVIVVVVVAWWLGFARSARKVAEMATSEIDYLSVSHKGSIVKRAAEIKVTATQAQKAAENVALVNSFDIFAMPVVAQQQQQQGEAQS